MTWTKIPSLPKPRDRYRTETEPFTSKPGTWSQTHVVVWEVEGDEVVLDQMNFIRCVTEYDRNYRMLGTFEPFRQLGDDGSTRGEYALVAADYTATSVMDLSSGEIVASEPHDAHGFCPVGFYVPDWHDVHDGSIEPGSEYWDPGEEQPVGDFGFVWGCHWGDDTSWKLQYLDLSRIAEGEIARDNRFGYLELATIGDDPSKFINVWVTDNGNVRLEIAALQRFGIDGEQTRRSE